MGNKLLSFLLFFFYVLLFSFRNVQENTTPNVSIVAPTENSGLEWNSVIPYRINVNDKEDGNSEYEEIDKNEVILTVTYFPDASKIKKYVALEVAERSALLSKMATSNCFSCHSAKSRLIGPSFEEIAGRYDSTPENKAYLAQKIGKGSTGTWGDEIMPAQPELKEDKVYEILDWIFKNAQDPNYTFYTGTEGAFKTRERPKKRSGTNAYVLHAQYADQGQDDSLRNSKMGIHTLVFNVD